MASFETAVYAVSCYLDTMVQQSLAGKEEKEKKKKKKARISNDDTHLPSTKKKLKNSTPSSSLRPDPGHLCARRRRRTRDLPVALHSVRAPADDRLHQRVQRSSGSGAGKREERRRLYEEELLGR